MSYFKTRDIKATRKVHKCDGCGQIITVGSPAFYWAGDGDGELYYYYMHFGCRETEKGWNERRGYAWDEWTGLEHLFAEPEVGDLDWLQETFPSVYARLTSAPVVEPVA